MLIHSGNISTRLLEGQVAQVSCEGCAYEKVCDEQTKEGCIAFDYAPYTSEENKILCDLMCSVCEGE